jgi:organic radical activating enzyme
MLSGEKPPQCVKCHTQEGYGKVSRRKENNVLFDEYQELVSSTSEDGTVSDMKFRYMDFRFSNICNLRCKMCMPLNSTSLYEDFEKIYGPQSHTKVIRPSSFNPTFMPEVMDQLEHVKVIYFAGGEPLLMEEHYEVLKHLIKIGRAKDVQIAYNTNFTKLSLGKQDVTELWKHFPKLEVYASLDGSGEALSYLRKGADWHEILENREKVRVKNPHVEFFVTPVLSLMNALRMGDFYDELVRVKFISPENFLLYFLFEPTFFCVHVLPPELKLKARKLFQLKYLTLKDSIRGGHTLNSFQSGVAFLNDKDHTHLLPEFRKHIRLFDEAQETDFATTFPELVSLLTD